MHLSFDSYFIEPIQTQDAWNICNFVVANEDRLKRYFPLTLKENLTPDLSKLFTEIKVKEFEAKEEFLFLIKEKETKALVGLIYLKKLDWVKKRGELAYCIGYEFEGKGITTNAVTILSDYTFNNIGLKTLEIIVHKTNIASIKVAENCNFIWIKTLKKEHTPPGENPLDMELYELYNEIE
ncbi:GNAT family N-acetyltransferase [Sabulilitoribacter multivorans]|uniref:GNAT family N-acetyltransferase n=1 Tax=Flaviramulus multivorans TaxID=1304750 RepID=A0ABS9IFY9_9FLAO|nr:GNAT family protein [Flaviramulus multivorans]MCF7559667.1 GNAT family N-acetyltransferase [Flaviramulus multivorans]